MTVVVASTVLSDSSPSGSEDSTWNAAVIDPPMFATAGIVRTGALAPVASAPVRTQSMLALEPFEQTG